MACQVYYFMYQKGVLCFPSQIRKNCDPENPKIFFFGDLKFSKIYLCCHIHFCNLFFLFWLNWRRFLWFLTCLLLFNSLNAVYFRRYLWLVCVRPLIREKTSTRRRCIHRGGARELLNFIVSSRAKYLPPWSHLGKT